MAVEMQPRESEARAREVSRVLVRLAIRYPLSVVELNLLYGERIQDLFDQGVDPDKAYRMMVATIELLRRTWEPPGEDQTGDSLRQLVASAHKILSPDSFRALIAIVNSDLKSSGNDGYEIVLPDDAA